jgi:hypothetical protein
VTLVFHRRMYVPAWSLRIHNQWHRRTVRRWVEPQKIRRPRPWSGGRQVRATGRVLRPFTFAVFMARTPRCCYSAACDRRTGTRASRPRWIGGLSTATTCYWLCQAVTHSICRPAGLWNHRRPGRAPVRGIGPRLTLASRVPYLGWRGPSLAHQFMAGRPAGRPESTRRPPGRRCVFLWLYRLQSPITVRKTTSYVPPGWLLVEWLVTFELTRPFPAGLKSRRDFRQDIVNGLIRSSDFRHGVVLALVASPAAHAIRPALLLTRRWAVRGLERRGRPGYVRPARLLLRGTITQRKRAAALRVVLCCRNEKMSYSIHFKLVKTR